MHASKVKTGLCCRKCGHTKFSVIYTRPAPAPASSIVRRRACRRCGARVTTWERIAGS